MWAQHVILLDEPTAALGVIQTAKVLELIRAVRDRGLAVIFISHNLRRCSRSPTGSRSCAWARGSPASAASDADAERLIAAISGTYANEVEAS